MEMEFQGKQEKLWKSLLPEELKRSQALLSRAEKLSFLGNMAARLAHEIKNPMTAIGTFIQMLPQKYDNEEFRTEFHEIAMEETARVNNLITELMDLVKTKESHFELNDVNELIDRAGMDGPGKDKAGYFKPAFKCYRFYS
jgi:signal transduction histidine kinase